MDAHPIWTDTRNPDLAGAFVGVGLGAQGDVPALQAAGKVDQVKTVAFDAFIQNMKLLQEGKLDRVVSVAARDYGAAVGILKDLGIRRVRLLSNNPEKGR